MKKDKYPIKKLKVVFTLSAVVLACGSASAVSDVDLAAAETGFADKPTDAPAAKWPNFSLHAVADIESAYICRGYIWDRRPYSAQSIDGTVGLGPFGRADVYCNGAKVMVWVGRYNRVMWD